MNVVLPRVRDFKGVSTKSFDGRGNYTLGLHDQLIFPEIDYAKVDKTEGHERHDCDHGPQRRSVASVAEASGHAVPGVAIETKS